MFISTNSPDSLDKIVEALLPLFEQGYFIVLLKGEMGSGKTTLVKALCQNLGVEEAVTSPTFSLVQEYRSPSKGILYHMDLYRLDSEKDLEQIGFAEYLDSGNICLIEWPLIGNQYYTMAHAVVDIQVENHNIRNFKITTHDAVDA